MYNSSGSNNNNDDHVTTTTHTTSTTSPPSSSSSAAAVEEEFTYMLTKAEQAAVQAIIEHKKGDLDLSSIMPKTTWTADEMSVRAAEGEPPTLRLVVDINPTQWRIASVCFLHSVCFLLSFLSFILHFIHSFFPSRFHPTFLSTYYFTVLKVSRDPPC